MKLLKNYLQKQKRNLCLLVFLIGGLSSFSQDTLFYLNGSQKVVNLLYHSKNSITFREFPDGMSDFVIGTLNIEKIKTFGGTQYLFNTKNLTENKFDSDKQSNQQKYNSDPYQSNNKKIDSTSSKDKDIILQRSGEEILAKVLTVGEKEISYKKADFLEGPTYTILKSNIFIITYSNGVKDIFSNEEGSEKTYSNSNFAEATEQGETDAIANYRTGGAFAAGFSTFILTPVLALIPTGIITSVEPNDSNLKYPNVELYNTNPNYKAAYKKQAFKMKKKAVWTGYGLGAFINIAVALIIYIQ